MALTQPLAELRKNLEAQVRDNQLPDALKALLELLPEGSETQRIVSALITRLNAANKERFRNTISTEEYQRRVDQVSADFFDLVAGLTEESFEEKPASAKATPGKAGKAGSVLYRVPHTMRIQKPVRCTIRVAVDEDAILENIVLDSDVQIKSSVEISDVMRAELLDAEGGVFQISPLNAPNQLVRETGYTEWNFSVTPLREGVHQLLVKVSIMEIVPGFSEPVPRDVSVMETVTIFTEEEPGMPVAAPTKSSTAHEPLPFEFKSSGQSFAFHSSATAQGAFEINYSKSMEDPGSSPPSAKSGGSNRGLRALALFLAFLVLAPAATWALSPKLDRELFLATWQTKLGDNAAPLDAFISEHSQDPAARPYLDKAYFRRAEKTDSLGDLRAYQREFGADGKYRQLILEKIETHEIKTLESIKSQPNALKIRQFVSQFPESERLPELIKVAENHTELLTEVENAYVRSVQAQPTETKVAAYLRDFPKQERLGEIAEAVASNPELLEKARPVIEEAITRKAEVAATAEQLRAVLPAIEAAGSSKVAEKVEKIVEQKPAAVKNQVRQQIKRVSERVKEREKSLDKSGSKTENKLSESSSRGLGTESSTSNEQRNRRSGLEMVPVQGGTFTMGSPESEEDRSEDECQHQVTVKSFSIGKYEVTQADWFEIMGKRPSKFENCEECPVENVSWNDVQEFLKALKRKFPRKNYRLPTEAEWEYAARGGNKSRGYLYSGSNDLKRVAWSDDNSGGKTHRVGELAPNELGIFDMCGNVWEWCQDFYNAYPDCEAIGREGSYRVLRGGSWSGYPRYCRVADRSSDTPGNRYFSTGFRLARTN